MILNPVKVLERRTMAKQSGQEPPRKSRTRPATTPEQSENRMIALAVEAAEQQMRAGTASSQVITHYLKLGSSREQLEQERLRRENLLLEAKVESMESAKRVEELYKTALTAMRSYAGQEVESDEDEDLR